MYDSTLKVFVEVADCGSFTKAADRLYISAPAIMKQMNLFEKDIGLKLLIRTPRGIHLTEAGKSIYKDARYMVQYAEESIERAYRAQQVERHVVRIGTSMLYPSKNLMDLWSKVSDAHPQFKLRVVPFEDSSSNTAHRELGKNFDIIAGVYDSTLTSEYCRLLPLGEYRFCLAMSKKHPLAKKEIINLFDLDGEHLMIMKPGNSPANDKIRQEIEEAHPGIVLEDAPHHYDVEVFNACEENEYLLLTLDGWHDIHPSLATVPLDLSYTIPHGIIYAAKPNEDTKQFLEIVQGISEI